MLSALQSYDTAILNFIQAHLRNGILDIVMPAVTFLGNNGLVWVVIALLLMFVKKYRYAGFLVGAALLLNLILGDILLKNLIQRPRPFLNGLNIDLLIPGPTSYSFPSGHTSSSFAAAGVLSREFRKYRILIYALASIIALSRMYLYVHYLTDILGGMILGLLSSEAVLAFHASRKKAVS